MNIIIFINFVSKYTKVKLVKHLQTRRFAVSPLLSILNPENSP